MSKHQSQNLDPTGLPRTLTSSIEFLRDLPLYKTEKPFFSNIPFLHVPGAKQHNIATHVQPGILVHDLRGRESLLNIDDNGFQLTTGIKLPDDGDFDDDEWVVENCYGRIEGFLRQELKADSVLIFDHVARKHNPQLPRHTRGGKGNRQPSFMAHCDNTFTSGIGRFQYHLNMTQDDLRDKRCCVINVWRPLFGPIRDYPLAFCDPNSVNISTDLVAGDVVFPHYIGEQWYMKYNPDHKWYYISDQVPAEAWIFKCYDSKEAVTRFVPHTSFDLGIPGARPRESVEFRCLVVIDTPE